MSGKQQLALALKNRKTLIVGAIADQASLKIPAEDCDVVELRLDSLGTGDAVISYAEKCPLPLLITARGALEGGQNDLSVAERRAMYDKMMPFAAAIDIELITHEDFFDVIQKAKDQGVIVVGSFHNFEKTPQLAELLGKISGESDIFKFATMVNEPSDLEIHRSLLANDKPLSVMGMGPLGAEARPEMIKQGSLLNYGFLGETPTAPDQWPVAELSALSR